MKRAMMSAAIVFLFVLSACSGTTGQVIKEPAFCTDSDGGVLVRTKGTTSGVLESGEAFKNTDFCLNDIVVEYYCEENKPENRNHRCSSDCNEGACQNPFR